MTRAAAAEAGFEAILVKLASERKLQTLDIRLLGCFRESYQVLRESIRENQRLLWRASPIPDEDAIEFKQYIQFKSLAEYVVVKLADPPNFALLKRRKPDQAVRSLREITKRKEFKNNWWKIAEQELGDASSSPGG